LDLLEFLIILSFVAISEREFYAILACCQIQYPNVRLLC